MGLQHLSLILDMENTFAPTGADCRRREGRCALPFGTRELDELHVRRFVRHRPEDL